jgi:hypothetical protein
MRPNPNAVLMLLVAAAAATAQTVSGVPRAAVPGFSSPAPTVVAPAQTLPSATAVQTTRTVRDEPGLVAPERLTTFDPQRTELVHNGNNWQLMVDGTALTDFGAHESDARIALRLLRDLGLNQHATVGAPAPVMEYWLHDGKAPHGLTNGLQVYPLDAASLRVEQHEGDWCLRDAQRLLFNFGASTDDARQALAVIRKYGFTQVGTLGQGGPVMLVFLGRNPSPPVVVPPSPLPLSPRGSIRPVGFDPASRTAQFGQIAQIAQSSQIAQGSQPIPAATTPAPLVTTGPGEGTPATERMPVDWRQSQIQKDGNVWKLTSDGHEVARFNSERDAHLALSAVLYYHFTEREQVGSPKPHFSYYLVDGQVPRGAMIGVHAELFQPERLRVVQVGDRWTISNGERALLSFDDRQDEARHVLDVIQHNKCDRLCRIGLTDEFGLTFLARSR